VDVSLHLHDAPRVPVADVAAGLPDGLGLAALEADFDHALGALGCVDHRPAFADVVGERLLAIDVEVAAAGVDEGQCVPVRRSGDDHGLKAGNIQQVAVMLKGEGTTAL